MSYYVKLKFSSGDKEYQVLRSGFKLGDQVGEKGKHVTQTCSLQIRSAEASMLFLQETGLFIEASLVERVSGTDTVLFEGVVRPYQSVSAKNKTEDNFNLEIMDYTELMEIKKFSTEELTDKTLGWLVGHVYDFAELTPDLRYPAEMDNIDLAFPVLDADKYDSVAALLSSILFEFGYDYKFTPGYCVIFRTWLESATGLSTVAAINQLKVQRDDNWTDGIRVKYGVASIARDIPLANWVEDISDLQWWRYILPYSYSESSGTTTRTVSYDLSKWAQKPAALQLEHILYTTNVRVNGTRCTINSFTAGARSASVNFSWSERIDYVWGNVIGGELPAFSVRGDIVYALPGDYEEQITGEKPDEFSLLFVQDIDGAKDFAAREYKRAKVAPITYTFQSLSSYSAGSFVRLTETVIGVNVPIRIISCNKNADGIYSIKAESADYLGMSVSIRDLKMRDVIELANSLLLNASVSNIVDEEAVTVTASGSIIETLENEGSTGYSFLWQLNGVDKPEWTGLKVVTTSGADLDAGKNTFTFKVAYSGNVINTAAVDVNKAIGFALMETKEQYYISSSPTSLMDGEWKDVLISFTTGYLWRRLKYAYSDGTTVYGEPFCVLEQQDVNFTVENQYGLSTSDEEFILPDTIMGYTQDSYGAVDEDAFEYGFKDIVDWSSDVQGWHRGLYVWTRTKLTDSYGNVTYGEPVYCKEITESLEASCRYEAIPELDQYLVNKADATNTDEYWVDLLVTGYSAADMVAPISAATVVGPDGVDPSIGTVTIIGSRVKFEIDRNTPLKQVIITLEGLYGEVARCTMTANDLTQYGVYGGVFASEAAANAWFVANCGGVVDGYSFVDSSNTYAIKAWYDGAWHYLSQAGLSNAEISEVCGKAQKDVLGAIEAGSVTMSDYAYFNVVVAGVVTADYVKALKGVFTDIEVSGSISVDHQFVYRGVFRRDRFYPEWF